jgi:hypothetical protein
MRHVNTVGTRQLGPFTLTVDMETRGNGRSRSFGAWVFVKGVSGSLDSLHIPGKYTEGATERAQAFLASFTEERVRELLREQVDANIEIMAEEAEKLRERAAETALLKHLLGAEVSK